MTALTPTPGTRTLPWLARAAVERGLLDQRAMRTAIEALLEQPGRSLLDILDLEGAERGALIARLIAAAPDLQRAAAEQALTRWARPDPLRAQAVARARARAADDRPGTALWRALAEEPALGLPEDELTARGRYRCPACTLELDLPPILIPHVQACPGCGLVIEPAFHVGWDTVVGLRPDRLAPAARPEEQRRLMDEAVARWAIAHAGVEPAEVEAARAEAAGEPLHQVLVGRGSLDWRAAEQLAISDEAELACESCGVGYVLPRTLHELACSCRCPACELLVGGGEKTVATRREGEPAAPAPEPSRVDRAGRTVGPYRLEHLLGRGGMGDVYAAVGPAGEQVALKLLAIAQAEEVDLKRFEREGAVLEGLRHENLVTPLAHGVDPQSGLPYIALERVRGRDLRSILNERPVPRLSIEEGVWVLHGCARGLAAAHAAGVIHRDVKPANVLTTSAGDVKLTDFGIALSADASVRLTAEDEIVGTPQYIPPEVVEGSDWTPAADMYALGSFAFRVLAGRPLFEHERPVDVIYAHLHERPPRLRDVLPSAPAPIAELVDRLLSKRASERPTAAELAEALVSLLPPQEALARLAAQADEGEETPPEALLRGAFRPGQTFHHFRLDEELGRGGMGVVYRAFHHGLRRDVALKVLLSGAVASEEERRRFLREAEAAGALNHPNLVRVLDAGQHRGVYFLCMDYVRGARLGDHRRGRPRDLAELHELLGLFVKVCDGVQHAHAQGIVHRDLKPDNIIVSQDGEPHVLDFGIAKKLDLEEDGAGTLTTEGDVLGTLRYMPPEQAAGEVSKVDIRSDVYALGSILYELACGETPFGGSIREQLHQILMTEPRPPGLIQRRFALPWELDAIALKALEKERDERYQSVIELRRDVERYLEGRPITARQASLGYRARKWLVRNRWSVAAGAAFLLGTAALLGSWTWDKVRAERARVAAIADDAREGWRQFALDHYDEAHTRFKFAFDRATADDLLPLPPGGLAIPPDVYEALPGEQQASPFLTKHRLATWLGLARRRLDLLQAYRQADRARARLRQFQQRLDQGEADVAAESLDEARRAAQAALELVPRDEDLLQLNARIAQEFLGLARARLAEHDALAADALEPRQGALDEARRHLDQAAALDRGSEEVRAEQLRTERAADQLRLDRDRQRRLAQARQRLAQAAEAEALAAAALAKAAAAPQGSEAAAAEARRAEEHLGQAAFLLTEALAFHPDSKEGQLAVTRVRLAQAELLLGQGRHELAADRLRYARIHGHLTEQVAALEERLRAASESARDFARYRREADDHLAAGRHAKARDAYAAALRAMNDPAVRRRHALALALAEADEAHASADLAGERRALRRARPLHDAPATLDPRIARLEGLLYEEALAAAEQAATAAAARGGGWTAVAARYEAALAFRRDGAEALRGRADALARAACPADMVLVSVPARLLGEARASDVRFYVDRDEVTHERFEAFARDGGYARRELWSDAGWAARARLVDGTGQPGASGWSKGRPQAGSEALPVTGVSFHEAEAFARWAKRRLPTEREWLLVACLDPGTGRRRRYPWGDEPPSGLPDGPRAGGAEARDVSPFGARDLALNVSEWLAEGAVRGLSFRAYAHDLEGGLLAWVKRPAPTYRDAALGFRCAADVPPPPPLRLQEDR